MVRQAPEGAEITDYCKAPPRGAFFVLALLLGLTPPAAPADECTPERRGVRATVARVFDGDTVQLAGGERVRLIGINAPEAAREKRPAQPLADEATRALETLAGPGGAVWLVPDAEREDKYGRVLAHLFDAKGRNIQREMLARGLAAQIVVPPNERFLDCYRAAERSARDRALGVWSLDAYRPASADELSGRERGFKLITGRVTSTRRSRSAVWLRLSPRFAIQIPLSSLERFGASPPEKLVGKRVTVRGWIKAWKGRLRISVNHPAALEVHG